MARITLPPDLPGIRGPMAFRPETGRPLNEREVLLRGPHPLTPGERELIATYVSAQNDCEYCQTIHGAVAAHHLDGDDVVADKTAATVAGAPVVATKLETGFTGCS